MIRVGLIGYGAWGPNLARCLAASGTIALATVCDVSAARLALVHRTHPGIRLDSDWRAVVNDTGVDAVAIATPATTHFELGMAALRAGKHVLVEKPLASWVEQASTIVELGERRRLTVMVDHTYLFSPAVRDVKEMLSRRTIGTPLLYRSERYGAGHGCADVDVLWDLAVHDLALIDYLLPSSPDAVQATGTARWTQQPDIRRASDPAFFRRHQSRDQGRLARSGETAADRDWL